MKKILFIVIVFLVVSVPVFPYMMRKVSIRRHWKRALRKRNIIIPMAVLAICCGQSWKTGWNWMGVIF